VPKALTTPRPKITANDFARIRFLTSRIRILT
jgi:hypothetical protein